ncbi:conserved hypothetical protein [Sulfurimonas denitrificans DSM 1251]|uniref:TonB C-terminal domain-containing protein n=2 Tax=Sulfurimonas denitrificans TaxID=39766 RepID=Q30RJ3_SULDN|nr:conserved hypothetical protein [Sulfurimonas denitrificans DSM 1251]
MLLFWLLGTITPEIKKIQKPEENKIKLSLKEIEKKVQKDDDGEKKVIEKTPDIAPQMQRGKQLKEITKAPKKEPIKYDEQKISEQKNTSQLNKSQEPQPKEPKPKTEPLPPTKPYIPLLPPHVEEKKEKSSDPLAWMREDKSEEQSKDEKVKKASGSSVGNSDLRELYGDEFSKFTEGQQKYLIDNQEIMRRITQEILNRVASVNLRQEMNVNKVNIVEFYLHPNGDMSDFKFLQNSGYHILDSTTQETIEFAYSRYPRPKEKILIRYNVFYNLAR